MKRLFVLLLLVCAGNVFGAACSVPSLLSRIGRLIALGNKYKVQMGPEANGAEYFLRRQKETLEGKVLAAGIGKDDSALVEEALALNPEPWPKGSPLVCCAERIRRGTDPIPSESLKVFELLMQHDTTKASINEQNKAGFSALLALLEGRGQTWRPDIKRLSKALLDLGADPNLRVGGHCYVTGWSALDFVADDGNLDLLNMFLDSPRIERQTVEDAYAGCCGPSSHRGSELALKKWLETNK